MKMTSEIIEVMNHFQDGGKVQYHKVGSDGMTHWVDCPGPDWNWGLTDYRKRPRDPRVFYTNDYGTETDQMGYFYPTESKAIASARPDSRGVIKLVEVLEDVD
jgi:hypothetical protein